MWFAGSDWADKHHDVVVLDEAGQRLSTRRYLHSAEGLASRTADLRTLGESPEEVVCVVEVRQGLLIAALLEAGLWVARLNPKTVDRTRPASGAKSDQLDALLLARAGRRGWPDLRRLQPDAPLLTELKALTRDQTSLIRQQTRLVNQLTACLKADYPVALELFDKLTRPVAQAFLTAFPTLEAARAASEEEVQLALRTAHCPSSAQKAARFWAILHREQLVAPPALVRAKARYALALVAQLQVIHHQLLDYDRAIGELFRQHEDSVLFASLPGAGRRLAPRLLAEWGDDRTRFSNAAQLQALAGTAPVVIQSGASRRVRQRTGCVKPLRAALYQLARESLLFEDWAHAYYQRKRGEGKTYAMAVRALSNQGARLLYAMWSRGDVYQRDRFLAAQQAHRAPAA
jgi:transposase